jgi:hypothetical protein
MSFLSRLPVGNAPTRCSFCAALANARGVARKRKL